MLAFAFLNPFLLWALPIAAVPIVIHLLNRRRFQRVPWAAMEFLLAAMKRNRKRLRMEQWLVLLLRTLAVLFLVLLVARPQLTGSGLVRTRTHHVVVLDDTASMRQRGGSTDLFEKAQDRIRTYADQLGETRGGDLFSLVRVSHAQQPEVWTQRVGPDLGKRVGELVKQVPVGDGSMDLGEVLKEVRRRAGEVKEASRTEYHLFTDLRASDWLTEDDKARPALLAGLTAMDKDREHLFLSPDEGRDAENLAIVGIRRLDRVAVVGVPCAFAVDVQNLGLDAAQPNEVVVEMDGKTRIVQQVPALAPGERTSIQIDHTFHAAGYHRIEAGLHPADHYATDDRRWFALEVKERSKVLLIDGDPGETSSAVGETYFLQVALDPGGEAVSGIEVQVAQDNALAEQDLAPFDMVWLCNVAAPAPNVVQKLEKYVGSGGGLVLFAGAQVDPNRYNEAFWQGGKGLLPMAFGEIAGDPDRPEHMFLAKKDHPICGKLGEIVELVVANAVLVKRYLTMVEDPKVPAAVMIRVRDAEGSPLVASRTYGSGGGEVVQFGITAGKQWSNWPDTVLNVVIANQLHRFAVRVQDPAAANLGARGTYHLTLDPGIYKADVTVRGLAEEGEEKTFTAQEPKPSTPPTPSATEPAAAPQLSLDVPMADLRALGAYEVELHAHANTSEKRLFARNVPIEESRLARLSETAFQKSYPAELADKLTFVRAGAGSGKGSGEGEVWRFLALALLVGLLAESFLAWRFGRR